MTRGLLSVEKLGKRFGGLHAVRDVSFNMERGEIVGLLGPNGAGKTTLFNLLTGYLTPDTGVAYLEDMPILGLTPNKLVNCGLARTFQLCRPFAGMSVLDNVAVASFPSGKKTKKELYANAGRIIELAGLKQVELQMAEVLPYGDLRRLEIARALATGPRLLLLDEPFAGLAAGEIGAVVDLIKNVHAQNGLSILIIEHHLQEFMKLVQRVIALDFGQVIAEGKPSDIVKDDKVIEAYLGRDDDFEDA